MFSDCMIIAIAFVLGVILSHHIGMTAVLFAAIAVFVIFLIRSLIKKAPAFTFLFVCLAFAFGSLRYYGASQNRLYQEFPEKYVTVTGFINSQPAYSEDTYQNRYTLKADAISYLQTTYSINTNIILSTKEAFNFGDKITASGFLTELEGISNENEYDFSLYYKSRGIYNRLTAYEISKVGKKTSFSPAFLFGTLRQKICNLTDTYFDGNRAAFLKAITTGNKTGFSRDYSLLLTRTGMKRVLYASYLHITLISLIAAFLCSSKKNRDFTAMLLLIIYALFNSGSPSILKAAALSGIIIFRKSLFGFANKADVLSLIVLVMTVIDPMLCFNSGFAMSVISTLMVYLSFPTLYKRISAFFLKHRIKSPKLYQTLTIWIILVVGTLPFSAYYYNGSSVYAIPLMTLLMPAVIVIIALSPFLFLLLTVFGTAPVIGTVIDKLLQIFERIPYLVQKLPFYYLPLKTPSLLAIIIFCLSWWICIRRLSLQTATDKTRVLSVIMCGLMVSSVSEYSFNTLSIYFVNVGQGDGAVLCTTAGDTILIDGGGAAEYQTDYNLGEAVYLPYLISHGFTDIDTAIVSHYHKDHVEGIIAAAENLKINTLIMPDSSPDNLYRLKLEEIAQAKNINVRYLMENDEIRFKSGLTIKFLAPDRNQLLSPELNDTSLVAEIRYGEFCAVFTGDSTDKLSEEYPADIDILKVAHHGSDTGSFPEYVKQLSPAYAVVSVGEDNSYGLPSKEVLQRFNDEGSKILRTDKLGDIRFKIKKNGKIKYTTLKGG